MPTRLELHALLKTFCENVYFQPPPDVKMVYPAIVYKLDDVNTRFADNRPYSHKERYQVTVIDRDPDSDIHKKIGMLPLSSYDRSYAADQLNHNVYTLFF